MIAKADIQHVSRLCEMPAHSCVECRDQNALVLRAAMSTDQSSPGITKSACCGGTQFRSCQYKICKALQGMSGDVVRIGDKGGLEGCAGVWSVRRNCEYCIFESSLCLCAVRACDEVIRIAFHCFAPWGGLVVRAVRLELRLRHRALRLRPGVRYISG